MKLNKKKFGKVRYIRKLQIVKYEKEIWVLVEAGNQVWTLVRWERHQAATLSNKDSWLDLGGRLGIPEKEYEKEM